MATLLNNNLAPDGPGGGRAEEQQALTRMTIRNPWLAGGSADLSPSTKTRLTFPEAGEINRDSFGGKNIHFGVREHMMGTGWPDEWRTGNLPLDCFSPTR